MTILLQLEQHLMTLNILSLYHFSMSKPLQRSHQSKTLLKLKIKLPKSISLFGSRIVYFILADVSVYRAKLMKSVVVFYFLNKGNKQFIPFLVL